MDDDGCWLLRYCIWKSSHNNIHNLYQLSQLSRADLCGIRLIGIVTVNEIIEKAAEYGVNIPEGD